MLTSPTWATGVPLLLRHVPLLTLGVDLPEQAHGGCGEEGAGEPARRFPVESSPGQLPPFTGENTGRR